VAQGTAYENLVGWDIFEGQPCSFKLTPWLAEGWRWLDSTTLEFSLKKGVRFHNKPPVNGRELVADDLIFSYQRLFDAGIHPIVQSNVASMEATDKYTFRMKFKEPSPLVIAEMMAHYTAPIMAREAGGPKGDFAKPETAIGTGAFMVKSSTPGVDVVSERNPDFRIKGLPYLDQIRLSVMRDQSTRVAALEVGRLDILDEMTTADKVRVSRSRPAIKWVDCETSTALTLVMNHNEPPFGDVRVRRAVSMAIDRPGIVKGIFGGEGNVIGVTSAALEGALRPDEFSAETRRYLELNPAEAKRLLAQAGFPNGFSVEIVAPLHLGSPYNEQVQIVPPMLKAIGIDAKLRIVSGAEHQVLMTSLGYGKMGLTKSDPTGSRHPVEAGLFGFHSGQSQDRNRVGMKDPEYDKLVERATRSLDPKERLDLAKQLQIRLVDQANIIVFPAFFEPRGHQAWVTGEIRTNFYMWTNQTSWRFQDTWLNR
jgi:peptide/nickel transport system substrate-binding protein